MKINKLDTDSFQNILLTLKNYINAWHKIPDDIDIENLDIDRIRYVKEWGFKDLPENAFIVEFSTYNECYKELLGYSELGLTVDEFKILIEEQNKNSIMFGKDIITNQMWYKYAVIWGTLDDMFDTIRDYKRDGKYGNDDYTTFNKKTRR